MFVGCGGVGVRPIVGGIVCGIIFGVGCIRGLVWIVRMLSGIGLCARGIWRMMGCRVCCRLGCLPNLLERLFERIERVVIGRSINVMACGFDLGKVA